jgi:hypothetical protein
MNHTLVVHVEVPACSHGVASRSRPRRAAHDLANRLLDPLIQIVSAFYSVIALFPLAIFEQRLGR